MGANTRRTKAALAESATTGPRSRGAGGRAAAAESRAKAGGAPSDPRSAGRHREAQTRPARRASRRRARVGGQSDAAVTPAASAAGGPGTRLPRSAGGSAAGRGSAATCVAVEQRRSEPVSATCPPRALSQEAVGTASPKQALNGGRGDAGPGKSNVGDAPSSSAGRRPGDRGPSPGAGPGGLTGTGQAQLLQGPPRCPRV